MRLLTELRRDSFPPQWVVALAPGRRHTWADFLADIDGLRAALAARAATAYALYDSDVYRFAVALFALLAEGRAVYLPGDNHPAVVRELQHRSVRLLGEFPDAEPVALGRRAAGPAELALGGELVVFTSGSTGQPKAIGKHLGQLEAELLAQEENFGTGLGRCCVLGTVSHQHLYGLLFSLLWPLCAGRPFWHRPFVDPLLLARCAAAHGPSCWVMSPGHLHRLSADMPWELVRGSVRAVFSSGGPLQLSAARTVAWGLGILPWEILGSSETGGIARRQQQGAGQAWETLPQVETGLTELGTLKVRSGFLPDGQWYETQDRARFEAGGRRFHLGARVDRIVKLEGKRVALPQVEAAVAASPWIAEVHVAALERKRRVLGGVITLTPQGQEALTSGGQAVFKRALSGFLAARLPALAIPRAWRVVARLPRNAQGKLQQRQIDALFASRHLPPVLSEQALAGGCSLAVWADRNCRYFAGHFPERAVLPGVTQIMWAELLARDYLGLDGQFVGMRVVKFKEIVKPHTLLRLDLELDERRRRLHFCYSSRAGEHSQGQLLYGLDG